MTSLKHTVTTLIMVSQQVPWNCFTSFEISQFLLLLILHINLILLLFWNPNKPKAVVWHKKKAVHVTSSVFAQDGHGYQAGKVMLNEPWNAPRSYRCWVESVSPSTELRPLLVGVTSATDTLLFLNNKQYQTESCCHGDLSQCFCGDIVGFASCIRKTLCLGKTDLVMILAVILWRRRGFPVL